MRALLKLLKIFFVILGVLFLLLIIGVSYLLIADPFNLAALGISPAVVVQTVTGNSKLEIDNIDKNPLLTEKQEAQLELIGVDSADLPTEITPEMEVCFRQKLGEERTNEIIQGDSPTLIDVAKTRSCF